MLLVLWCEISHKLRHILINKVRQRLCKKALISRGKNTQLDTAIGLRQIEPSRINFRQTFASALPYGLASN